MQRISLWMTRLLVLSLVLAGLQTTVPALASTTVFINEIHYDNASTDVGEAIEIAGPAGTDLSGWSLVLYNGSNGQVYDTTPLSGLLPNQQGGYGTAVVSYPSNGIQNGSPDGVALVAPGGSVVQFLSYEGTFTAADGPAAGQTSGDIGAAETSSTPVGDSLQLMGSGTSYSDFTWAGSGPHTFGAPNTGQTFASAGPTDPSGVGAANPDPVVQGNGTLLTVSVTPGANPTSTGLAVTADLSAIAGSAGETLYDDGSNGDVTPGDGTFSLLFAVSGSVPANSYSLPFAISDAQSRTGSGSIALTVQSATPVGADVVISQVYGGGGNSGATLTHDFIELYNRSAAAVDISGWSVQYASSSGTSWQVTPVNGVLQPGQYYLIQQAQGSGGTTPLPTPDATGTIAMSGSSGKVALVGNSTALSGGCPLGSPVVDFVGYGGATCYEGSGATGGLNNTTAAIRNGDGAVDTNDNSADFTVGSPAPRNSSFGFDAAPTVVSVSPADGAVEVAVDANLSVIFSEAVNVSSSWFDISCTSSGSHTATVSGGPTSFSLDPDTDFATGELCTVTLFASQISDQDSQDPPDTLDADFSWSFSTSGPVCELSFTPAFDIQGSGASAAITGPVTTQGVVVGDYEGPSPTLRGFYLQDLTGDGDPATSDAVFVFNFNNDNVSLGQVVRVTGNAGEFQDQTQISGVSSIVDCGTGTVVPVDVTLPVPSADYLERYEGMLVHLPQTLYVTEHFQLGRFGQVVLSSGGRLQQPTNVAAPGAAALAVQAANDLNRIILDDAANNQNPDPILFGRNGQPLSASNTLRGGDTVSGIVGILTYTWAGNSASGNAYRVRPINALGGSIPNFVDANPRPASPTYVGGTLSVVGMNLLNYFNTFDGIPDNVDNCTNGAGGPPADCRGADDQAEFDRQWPKTVAAILGTAADIVGVVEIENDGYGPTSAIAHLVDRLNDTAGAGTYAFIDVDTATGQINALGDDAIKVGLLYQPASVTPVGATAALNSVAFVNGGDSAPRNRPALAQAFQQPNGETVIVSVNHFKSKGSACDIPDAGDGQGNCNAVRVNAATELASWLAADPTGTGDPDVLIIGDLNAYALEEPVTTLTTSGYDNLIVGLLGPDAYSYVFDGQWGYLDHALASTSLASQVTGVGEWHINADEPNVLDYNTNFKSAGQILSLYSPDQYRISDHDPVLVGLCLAGLPPALSVSVTPNVLWPPNHKYVTVEATVSAATDATVSLLSVTSNEPDNGLGDGDTPNDIVIVDNDTFQLRAERAGGGSGRVYTITYQATDACGDTATVSATVTVPHSQGNGKKPKSGDTEATAQGSSVIPEGFYGLFLPAVQR